MGRGTSCRNLPEIRLLQSFPDIATSASSIKQTMCSTDMTMLEIFLVVMQLYWGKITLWPIQLISYGK